MSRILNRVQLQATQIAEQASAKARTVREDVKAGKNKIYDQAKQRVESHLQTIDKHARTNSPDVPGTSRFSSDIKYRFEHSLRKRHIPVGVKYYSQEEREKRKLHVIDGKLHYRGKRLNTARGYIDHPFSSKNRGKSIYVQGQDNQFYLQHQAQKFRLQHSSFFGKERIKCAGEIHNEIRDGEEVYVLTNSSGHFKPSKQQLEKAAEDLRKQGVRNVIIEAVPGS